jgi:hypothetical protein
MLQVGILDVDLYGICSAENYADSYLAPIDNPACISILVSLTHANKSGKQSW